MSASIVCARNVVSHAHGAVGEDTKQVEKIWNASKDSLAPKQTGCMFETKRILGISAGFRRESSFNQMCVQTTVLMPRTGSMGTQNHFSLVRHPANLRVF